MSDEYINEQALEGSETSENNDISESDNQEMDLSSDVPQEDDARKFQSMYDKAQAELDKVKPVAQLFQENPELVDVVRNHLSGGKGQDKENIKIYEEEFNPWDAHTNPNSKSYQLREQEIEKAVNSKMQDYMGRLEAQRSIDTLKLRAQTEYKLSNSDANEFVEFVTKPKSAGLVQGGEPPQLSDNDNMWNNILKAGNPLSIGGKGVIKK